MFTLSRPDSVAVAERSLDPQSLRRQLIKEAQKAQQAARGEFEQRLFLLWKQTG